MEAAIADQLVAWTARLSVGCYLVWAIVARFRSRERPGARVAFGFYATGWLLMLVHFVVVFAFVHGWSHVAAYEHTARRTAEVVGLDWGGGLYFNYALAVIWGADILWCVVTSRKSARPPFAWTAAVHGYLVCMIFNATVVFGPTGWTGIAFGMAGVLAGIRTATSRRRVRKTG